MRYFLRFIGLLILTSLVHPLTFAGIIDQELGKIGRALKTASKYCVLLEKPNGKRLVEMNPNTMLIPASLTKIPLALAFYDLMGAGYRFNTEFLVNQENDLMIKGYGDPFLVSEELATIAVNLKNRGVKSVRSIHFDDSAFVNEQDSSLSGTSNPYDAITGALVINFNTVNVGKDKNGRVYSAEKQTPLTNISRKMAESLLPGKEDRFVISDQPELNKEYYRELIANIFSIYGITVVTTSDIPLVGKFKSVYLHTSSKSLDEIVSGLMKYSNNFIANQLFLTMGANSGKYPASYDQGRKEFRRILLEILPDSGKQFRFWEGSGLSRQNSTSCNFMIKVLKKFKHRSQLLSNKDNVLVKSGTLNGIYNYAGYIPTSSGLYPFSIIVHGQYKTRAVVLESLKTIALFDGR